MTCLLPLIVAVKQCAVAGCVVCQVRECCGWAFLLVRSSERVLKKKFLSVSCFILSDIIPIDKLSKVSVRRHSLGLGLHGSVVSYSWPRVRHSINNSLTSNRCPRKVPSFSSSSSSPTLLLHTSLSHFDHFPVSAGRDGQCTNTGMPSVCARVCVCDYKVQSGLVL